MKESVSADRTRDKEGSVGCETFLTELSVAVLQLYVAEHAKQHAGGVAKQHAGGVAKQHEGGVAKQHAGGVAKQHEGGVSILAAGTAAVSYVQQVAGVKRVTVCLDEHDDDTIFKDNNVSHLLELVRDKTTTVMYSHRKHCDRFDVIDLDLGPDCVAPYLDTAMNSMADGGLLLVSCYDTSISSGDSPDACYRLYGALSLKMSEEARCDEWTVRVLLKCVESHANRHGRYIEPVLSVSADSCVRIFMRVRISPVVCKQTLSKLSWVYQCVGCKTLTFHPLGVALKTSLETNVVKFSLARGPPVSQLCQHCQQTHHVGGPVWSAPIHCPEFVSRVSQLSSSSRLHDTLACVLLETHNACLYFTEAQLRARAGSHSNTLMPHVRVALKNAGCQVSCWHGDRTTLKTDASSCVVWDVVRDWVSHQAINHPQGEPASSLLDKQPQLQATSTVDANQSDKPILNK